jgi:hypothetical protein
MSSSLITFNPGIQSTLIEGQTKFFTFGTALSTSPFCFFQIPTAGKLNYLGVTYIPATESDKLVGEEFLQIRTGISRYNFENNNNETYINGDLITNVNVFNFKANSPYPSAVGIYTGFNEALPFKDLVYKNDLVAVEIFFDSQEAEKSITGYFSATLSFSPNCTF